MWAYFKNYAKWNMTDAPKQARTHAYIYIYIYMKMNIQSSIAILNGLKWLICSITHTHTHTRANHINTSLLSAAGWWVYHSYEGEKTFHRSLLETWACIKKWNTFTYYHKHQTIMLRSTEISLYTSPWQPVSFMHYITLNHVRLILLEPIWRFSCT